MVNVNDIDESTLWQNFLEGDVACLEKIYLLYFDDLYAYGNKLFRDIAFTEDVIQDLFVKLINNRQNLSPTTSLKYYLFRAFKSLALDKLKVKKRFQYSEQEENKAFSLELNPENRLIEKEQYEAIKLKLSAAIEMLTPRQREAIFLKYTEGFSYAEVTSMLALTPKATYKLMARAIQSLKDHIRMLLPFALPAEFLFSKLFY
ncbi:MAG: sigma-70 family RNA polymerase sigma factor [Ferruginibacter sp.]